MPSFRAEIVPGVGDFVRSKARIVAVLSVIEAVGENATAVDSLPPVQVIGKRILLVPSQLVREEERQASGLQELGKVAREPE